MASKNKLGKAEQDFVDRMGIVAEGDGLARITGRIWGLLMVTGDPLTSAEIADLLVISRGSVSTNMKRFPANRRIVEQAADAIDRPDVRDRLNDLGGFYALLENAYGDMLEKLEKRSGQ